MYLALFMGDQSLHGAFTSQEARSVGADADRIFLIGLVLPSDQTAFPVLLAVANCFVDLICFVGRILSVYPDLSPRPPPCRAFCVLLLLAMVISNWSSVRTIQKTCDPLFTNTIQVL